MSWKMLPFFTFRIVGVILALNPAFKGSPTIGCVERGDSWIEWRSYRTLTRWRRESIHRKFLDEKLCRFQKNNVGKGSGSGAHGKSLKKCIQAV